MEYESDKPDMASPAPNDPLDAEYTELMKLAGPEGLQVRDSSVSRA